MAKQKKCKTCGRMFSSEISRDSYCSPLCRTAGCFVAGGGDTSKPITPEMRKIMEKKGILPSAENPKRYRNGDAKFPRVHHMFTLPLSKRWEISKTFTAEEREYCRRLMKKQLAEERRFEETVEWDGGDGEQMLGAYAGIAGGSLGESDDGSI